MLTGGHEDDAAGVAREPRRELLGEQQRGADVLVEEQVDVLGGELVQPAVPTPRVVCDEDVEGPERVVRGLDDAFGRARIGEVRLHERNAELMGDALGATGLGLPRLQLVVRGQALDEDGDARLQEPPRNRVADPGAAADAGDEGVAHPVASNRTCGR